MRRRFTGITVERSPGGAELSLPLVIITFANMSLFGFLNSMRGVSLPLIKNGFNASYAEMGLMGAAASFASVCFCTAAGIYMNRFGLKKTIVTAFCIVILGAGSLHFAYSFWIALPLYLILQSGFGFFEIGLNGTGVRIFTVKSGLMLNLLHFFYGLGAIAGPRFMGLLINRAGLRWQDVYPLSLVLVFIFLALTLASRYPAGNPGGRRPETVRERSSFLLSLKNPVVWLFGIILGISGAIEGCSVSWSGLYLYDMYGFDPSASGAVFVSAFYILFTVSRFLSGFVIEKTGYLGSLFVSGIIIFVLFTAAFSLGRTGVYLLPVVGFFVALMWPTVLAVSVGVFGKQAQTASSAMISVGLSLSGIIQYGFGLSNRFLGAAWAYRSCVFYSAVLAALLFFLARRTRKARAGDGQA